MRKQQDLGGNHKATPRFHDNLPSTISCPLTFLHRCMWLQEMYTSSLTSIHLAHVPNHVLLLSFCVCNSKVLKSWSKNLAPSHVQVKICVQNVRLVSTDRVYLQQCHYHQNHAKGADAQFGNARALAVKEQAGHQAVAKEPRLNREQDLCTHTGNAFEALAGKAEQSADSQKLLL